MSILKGSESISLCSILEVKNNNAFKVFVCIGDDYVKFKVCFMMLGDCYYLLRNYCFFARRNNASKKIQCITCTLGFM